MTMSDAAATALLALSTLFVVWNPRGEVRQVEAGGRAHAISLIDWLVRSLEHDLQQTDELVRGRDSGVTERGPDSASARWPPTSRPSSPSDLDWIPRGDEFYPGRESNLNSSPRLLPAAVGRSPHVGARRWRALSHRG